MKSTQFLELGSSNSIKVEAGALIETTAAFAVN